LPGTGIPLGFMADYHYEKSPAILLSAGYNIVFITDGIVEAKSGNQEEFGFERTLAVLSKHKKSKALRIIKQLVRSVRNFADGHTGEDDMTAIVCKVLAEN